MMELGVEVLALLFKRCHVFHLLKGEVTMKATESGSDMYPDKEWILQYYLI